MNMKKRDKDKVKRGRSANFSVYERDILVSLMEKHQTVLQNKRFDRCMLKKKEAAWKSIQTEFNARSGVTFRSIKNLKIKYEGLKHTVRRKAAAMCSKDNTAPLLDNVEEQLKNMITLSADSKLIEESEANEPVRKKSTANQKRNGKNKNSEQNGKNKNSEQNKALLLDNVEAQITDMINLSTDSQHTQDCIVVPTATTSNTKCDVNSRTNLKSTKHPAQIGNVPVRKKLDVICSEQNTAPLLDNVQEKLKDVITLSTDSNETQDCIDVPTATTSNKNCDISSGSNLESTKQPVQTDNVLEKTLLDELSQTKLELVQLRKKFLKAEIIEKRNAWEFEENERNKESEFREKERKWKEEEYKFKLLEYFK